MVSGEGEVWRRNAASEECVRVSAGASLTIPPRTVFENLTVGEGDESLSLSPPPDVTDGDEWGGLQSPGCGAGSARDRRVAASGTRTLQPLNRSPSSRVQRLPW